MAKKKVNCWEYMKCERAPGGKMVKEKGVCPAAVDSSFEGINGGKNAGRVCWAVAVTCCGGKIQGTFAEKRECCTTCDFYCLVQDEEGGRDSESHSLALNQLMDEFCSQMKSVGVEVKVGESINLSF